MSELRLLSYNIHGLRDDVEAVSRVIRSLEPDVVCIQEAPRFMRWRSKRAAIARKAGLVVGTADKPAGLMLMTSLRARVLASRPVPMRLRNAPTRLMKGLGYGKGYRYAHDEAGAYAAGERYLPDDMPDVAFYTPTGQGAEARIREKLRDLRERDEAAGGKRAPPETED